MTKQKATPEQSPKLEKFEVSQRIADALGRGRLVIEQQLDLTDSWTPAAEMVDSADWDSIRQILDGGGKAT